MTNIGWNFPPTYGGEEPGINDAGIATFAGSRMWHLARETIQNSLDARASDDFAVYVEFAVCPVASAEFPDRAGFERILRSCAEMASEDEDDRAKAVIADAIDALEGEIVPFLRVSDRKTKGMSEERWKILLKKRGTSSKDRQGSGGSQGIGRNAPYASSRMRAVFYWTRPLNGGVEAELFQGKSVLLSHNGPLGQTQAAGFYGLQERCQPLESDLVPAVFRDLERHPTRGAGTSLWIAGFDQRPGWQERIAASVVSNYFAAIHFGQLEVGVDPSDEMSSEDLLQIEKANIHQWFAYLDKYEALDEDAIRRLSHGALYLSLLDGTIKTDEVDLHRFELKHDDLGDFELLVAVGEGLPRRVGWVRQTGMLITEYQSNLRSFNDFQPFIALARFVDPRGNELLKTMENPSHDQFEPDQIIDEDSKKRAAKVLRDVTTQIRNTIREVAVVEPVYEPSEVSELAKYLPDKAGAEQFPRPDAEGDEPDLGYHITIRRPPRNGPPPPPPVPTRKRFPISNVRILPITDDGKRFRLSFWPMANGVAEIGVGEAGDSDYPLLSEIDLFNDRGVALPSGMMELRSEERVVCEFSCADDLRGRALFVSALKAEIS